MKKFFNSTKFYIVAFLIPCTLLAMLLFYFTNGYGNPLIGALQPSSVLLNGLASATFLFYMGNGMGICNKQTTYHKFPVLQSSS